MVAANNTPNEFTGTERADEIIPAKEWSLDQLAVFAKGAIALTVSNEAAIPLLHRQSVLAYYRAGKALFIARDQLKQIGQFTAWMNQHQIVSSTAYSYIEFFNRVQSENDLVGLTLTQARQKYGVGQKEPTKDGGEKKAKPKLVGPPTDPLTLVSMATANVMGARDAVERGQMPEGLVQAVTILNAEVARLLVAMKQKGILPLENDRQIMQNKEVKKAA